MDARLPGDLAGNLGFDEREFEKFRIMPEFV
jgi:hypothetical protein